MTPTTIVELADVAGRPRVKMALPPLGLGDRLTLRFCLSRTNGGRSEVLDVRGDFQVRGRRAEGVHICLSVESLGVAPAWKAVKKTQGASRKLGPARMPPTPIP